MSNTGVDHYEWLRRELRKDPEFAAGYLELAAEEEALVIVMAVLDDVAEAYREQHPGISKKATQLRARLNDMRWPSLATGYPPLRETPKQQNMPKEPAPMELRHARRRRNQTRPAAATTG